ncbi:protein tyrosine phosphatase [Plasmopara halstedii]|uniref:diphosphoinositol-polyphosphate diphosphatase n=1 Tax=Plasmopara halstedii TaxID=4781 RepID=A0A0P1A5Y0_PLAHL|nr:protein tyrosine phosphatase [Plasmopara halstedii]CEG35992.1 protein tyrosine phosphatase [Plasmopara halstedii]|eukprot:XP_024572361.1 protein tyrosine phosphatase [Plasmopara halstedii]
MPPTTDKLFRWIEDRERERLVEFNTSWGRVLDAGETTLANELSVEFAPSKTLHATPLKVFAGNWQDAAFLADCKKFDVIIADYLIGAIEGFAPYYQEQICTRLEKLLVPGGRIYLVGLQPLSESQVPAGSSDADIKASKLIQDVARIRDACLLLASRRCYREYPIDWSHRQLEQSGLEVRNSVRLINVYDRSSITRQLEVGRRHVPAFQDADLANSMLQALDRVDERLKEVFGSGLEAERRKMCYCFYFYPIKTLIPPLNFSMVASGVYRSGFPNRKNHAFLQQLGLKSVLYLCHQGHQPENIAFFQENNIKVYQCPIDGNKEPFISINPDAMANALRNLLDVRNHPILVHCTKGTHRTGCVIGCMRKMENWSLTSIIDEYCRFAGPRMRLLDQQFIEFFMPTIQYDESQKPKWLSTKV